MKRVLIVAVGFASACSSASTSTQHAAAPSGDVIPRRTSSGRSDGLRLRPGGENGTYVQFPLEQREVDPSTSLAVNGTSFTIWTDFAPRDQGPQARAFDGAQVIYAGSLGDPQRLVPPSTVAGNIALVTPAKDSAGARTSTSTAPRSRAASWRPPRSRS